MANREVNLTKRIETSNGWRYCPVVLSPNGRVKPDVVVVGGVEERHPEGAYYIEWRDGTKRRRLSVGKNAADANGQRVRKEAELNAVNLGVALAPTNGNGRRPLLAAVTDFLDTTKLTHKPRTYAAYKTALGYFTESCSKLHVEDVERKDMLKFTAFLRGEKEQAPRSAYNKFEIVMTFLRPKASVGSLERTTGLASRRKNPKSTRTPNLKSCSTLAMQRNASGTSFS